LYLSNKSNVLIKKVYNGDASQRTQVVEVKWSDIAKKIKKVNPQKLIVNDAATKAFIPSTVIYKGKKPELLRYTVELSAGTSRFFELSIKK
jgi:unsaturated rhamnogalacturonyl hydrolase